MTNNDTFLLGGSTPIRRLGYGAMRITGPGVWGDPPDRDGAIALLRSLPELGVDFIDTADSYGPNVSEELIRDALAPYRAGTVVATKAGLARTGPGNWVPLGRPEYLIQQAYASLRRLGVEQIDLWQLHRIDPAVPRGEQFGAIAWLLEQGVIRHAGLSEVGVEEIAEARRYFPVATVQNRYNLAERQSEDVLAYAEDHGIGFIPWFPLAAGSLLQPGGVLDAIARRHGATPGQVALAWLLRRSPVMLPIPGTSSLAHLRENLGAWQVALSDEEFAALSQLGR
ncbi:aldo/keto reductase [Massilia sp. YIM B02763]|uniref:aldo/keto reductase n=1 Tax=Massilia sp. YIM B02763 TaxID=3050130 RepID=UPI0025B6A6F2|nr:aldo/keto reductase [Massilia sp. YIM B02763]MDN4054899.1 aldo/keto reductase [Massilia sp. YIM B02763]